MMALDPARAAVTPEMAARGHLAIEDVHVAFGGIIALDGLSIDVPAGEITGVIGPNGSGKTTLINVISGVQRPGRAHIVLDGTPLTSQSARLRARSGIARTFQHVRLFDSMTVLENVLMGGTRNYRSGLAAAILRVPRSRTEEARQRQKGVDILATFGDRLLPRLDHPVGTLSYANRRRVEIGRALMLEPSVLLLDEPTAGMNPHESLELAEQVPGLLKRHGCSAVLVEHKVDIVVRLCKDVYVLDHGQLLAHGDPAAVQRDPRVQEAFLGVD